MAKNSKLVLPLKKENERLVNENNDLHLSVIKSKETNEEFRAKWEAKVKSLEEERNDLKFVVGQKEAMIKKRYEEVIQCYVNNNALVRENKESN